MSSFAEKHFEPQSHSELSASGMDRWSACAASVRHCRGKKSIESDAAKEGTWAHDEAEKFVLGKMPAEDFWKLPEDMQAAIKVYGKTLTDDFEEGCVLLIEHKFDLSSVFPGCYGRADAVLWNPRTRVLRVYDFKYGKGHFVEVTDNLQMQYYGLGAVVTLKYPAVAIELVVVQPRCEVKKKLGYVRRWKFPAIYILDFEAFLVERAEATQDPNAPFVPGHYCYWCPGHTDCPAKVAERLSKAVDVFASVPLDDDEDFDPFS